MVGLIVAAVITFTGLRILIGSGRTPIDETLREAELAAIREVVSGFLGGQVVGYHDLRARHSGNHHQVDLHVQFTADTSLQGCPSALPTGSRDAIVTIVTSNRRATPVARRGCRRKPNL